MKKILVVEDELAYIKVLHDQLAAVGYEVIEAHDGKVGLETALHTKPDLILLDIRMPKMDGLTMLKELRKDSWGKYVNVMILTNLEDSGSISNALNEKLSRYIVKSDSTLDQVKDQVNMLLR